MEGYAQILQLLYEAIDEHNHGQPRQRLKKSPDTVLIGPSGKLDSLGFVALAATLEEKIERALGRHLSVIDCMFMGGDQVQWTVADFAGRLAQQQVAVNP